MARYLAFNEAHLLFKLKIYIEFYQDSLAPPFPYGQ